MADDEKKITRYRGCNRSDPSYKPQPEVRENKRDYGAIIKKYRLMQRISQKQIALDLGYNQNMLHFWESGISTPKLDVVIPLCNYLHIPYDEFFGNEMGDRFLSEDEARMLDAFRSMSPEAQKAVSATLSAMFSVALEDDEDEFEDDSFDETNKTEDD